MQHGSLPRGIRISEQRNGQGKNQVGVGWGWGGLKVAPSYAYYVARQILNLDSSNILYIRKTGQKNMLIMSNLKEYCYESSL